MHKKSFLFSISLCLLLVGCHQESQVKQKETFTKPQYEWGKMSGETLTIWGISPDLDRSYIKKACQRYEELTDNQLDIVQFGKDEINQQMNKALNGDIKMPDIFVSYGGTNIDAYHPDENFYDFTDAEWVDDLTETSINQTVYNGKIIGLPHWESSISGTLYNKKIFEKYNIQIPHTQAEFMQACKKLHAQGITPLYLPAKEVSMMLYQFPLDSVVKDSQILNDINQGKIGYSDLSELKQIVNWYKTMADKGYLGESYLDNNWDGMSPALESEKYAMLLCWDTWLYTDYKGNPDDFGLMPAFMGVPENGTFEGPNMNMFMVNKKSEKLEGALDFITFLADPYNYNVAFENILTAPVFKNQVKSISTPQYIENERWIDKNYFDSIAWLRIKGFSQMDASCILEYIKSSNQMTVDDCLEKMDKLRKERIS